MKCVIFLKNLKKNRLKFLKQPTHEIIAQPAKISPSVITHPETALIWSWLILTLIIMIDMIYL